MKQFIKIIKEIIKKLLKLYKKIMINIRYKIDLIFNQISESFLININFIKQVI